MRALLGTAFHYCEAGVFESRTVPGLGLGFTFDAHCDPVDFDKLVILLMFTNLLAAQAPLLHVRHGTLHAHSDPVDFGNDRGAGPYPDRFRTKREHLRRLHIFLT